MFGSAGRSRWPGVAGTAGIEPGKGKWDIPGGFLEADEHPEAGARRELREETGLTITITGLLGIYLDGYFYDDPTRSETTLNLCYLATADGEPQAGDDAAAVGWFAPDELPGADRDRVPAPVAGLRGLAADGGIWTVAGLVTASAASSAVSIVATEG